MKDKRIKARDTLSHIKDGDIIATGGFGMARKPMRLLREIASSSLKDLTLITQIGSLDVDLLIALGKVKKVIYGGVLLEVAGLAPNFRRAREKGGVEFSEWSEYTILAGIEASIRRLPFFPCRSGLGSDMMKANTGFKIFDAPFTGEKLVAIPALVPDVALIHVNVADERGYGYIEGDPFIDPSIAKGAKKVFLSAEKIVSSDKFLSEHPNCQIFRVLVDGVIEAPYGAHPTSCYPGYTIDLEHTNAYVAANKSPEAFKDYLDKFIFSADDISYLERIGGIKKIFDLGYGG